MVVNSRPEVADRARASPKKRFIFSIRVALLDKDHDKKARRALWGVHPIPANQTFLNRRAGRRPFFHQVPRQEKHPRWRSGRHYGIFF
jgi:hypothetical protein